MGAVALGEAEAAEVEDKVVATLLPELHSLLTILTKQELSA